MITQKYIHRIIEARHSMLEVAEIILAVLVFCAVVYFGIQAGQLFLSKDWSHTTVMYEFIAFILLILLGLEVTRLILVHNITVVMELMLLIIARKMLYPEIVALDLLYCTIAFACVVGVYYLYELKPIKSLDDLTK